jgi:hypothetical protein
VEHCICHRIFLRCFFIVRSLFTSTHTQLSPLLNMLFSQNRLL